MLKNDADNWQQPWGEAYVEGYSAEGKRYFDRPVYEG